MGGDQRRDRQKSEDRSRSTSEHGDVASRAGHEHACVGESEAPTRPRGRTIADSEEPALPHATVSTPAHRTTQDSFNPVRVVARSVRPPLSLWARVWVTAALVIVVGGGAIGVVTSLRARTLGAAGRAARNDRTRAANAAQSASDRGIGAAEAPTKIVVPAAVPGLAAPPPALPAQATVRNAVCSASAVEAPPTGSSSGAASARASPNAVAFRTPESLAISPSTASSSAVAPSRRTKPAGITTPPAVNIPTPPDESEQVPTPVPAASDAPETKGESEAWVTEERRF
jgi:hypothetical protein